MSKYGWDCFGRLALILGILAVLIGVKIMKFTDVMTTSEAAELWGLSTTSVKHLCTGVQGRAPRLIEGVECRKSGNTWLVTREGMTRLYGQPVLLEV